MVGSWQHLFVDGIIETPLPPSWKALSLDRYDRSWWTHQCLWNTYRILFHRVYPTPLKVVTLSWFMRFPTPSISYFATIMINFGMHFTTNHLHHLTFIASVNIQQEKEESLWPFIALRKVDTQNKKYES